jgi:hypothetical protein
MFKVEVLSSEILDPSTTSVPSISVLSKLVVPSISASPETSKVAVSNSPVIVMLRPPVISLLESATIAFEAETVPAVTPSIVSNSASFISAEPMTKLVPVIVVPVIAAALDPPIVTPSNVPPLISAVPATNASVVTVPSKNASLNSTELVPKSISLFVDGTIAPSVNVT